jgi:hypothetical protein
MGTTTALPVTPTGFAAWFAANANYVFFFAEIAYWFFMVVFVGYAVFQYKRWVNFQLGIGRSGHLKDAPEAESKAKAKDEDAVGIEEFVD